MMPFPGLWSHHASGGGVSPPSTGLIWWLKTPISGMADGYVFTAGGGAGNVWPDSSSSALNAQGSVTGASHPSYHSTGAGTINSIPVVQFNKNNGTNNSGSIFSTGGSLPSGYTTLTEASIYVVAKVDADPTNADFTHAGLVEPNYADPATDFAGQFPSSDGHIYTSMFTTVRKDAGNPTPAMTSPFYLGCLSASGSYKVRLNGTEIFTTATNTFTSDPSSTNIFTGMNRNNGFETYLDGFIAEILIYDHFLSGADITDLETYLANRFAI